MKPLRSILFLALVTFVTMPCLPAQVGIYGKLEVAHVSDSAHASDPNAWLYGPSAGIYYDFVHLGPASLGVDLRGGFLYGSNSQRLRSGLFGVRASVKPPLLPLRPYIQGSVGVAGAGQSGFHNVGIAYTNKFAYEVLGGIDVPMLPHLEWRAIEVGYGRVASAYSAVSPASTISVGTGVVLRLP